MRETIEFRSSNGVETVYADLYTPAGKPKGIVQVIHGMCEHIGRYQPVMEWLCEKGYAVCGHDQIGHGRSCTVNGTGYFAAEDGWDCLVKDARQLTILARGKWPGVPVFLLGHSMGSFLARTYLIRYPGTVAGAVLMGTGQMVPAVLAAARVLAAEEARRVGEDHASPLVTKLAFETYNRRFAPNRTAFDWLAANEESVDRYIADPLCGGDTTTGLFREMLSGIACVTKQENLRKMNLNTPVLFISGEDDPVGDMGKGVRRAYAAFRRAGVRDAELKLYPGLRHEILNEADRETVEIYWGIYVGKYKLLTNVPIAVASALSASVIPALTRARMAGDRKEMRRKTENAIRMVMLICIPSAFGLTALGGPILDLLNWNTDKSAPMMFLIGSAAVIFYGLSTLTNGILQGIDHMRIPVRNAVIALVSHLLVLVVLVQFTGIHIYGVVISYMFFALLMCVLNGLAIRKYLHYRQEIRRTFLIPGVSSLIMALAVWLAYTPLASLMGGKPAVVVCLALAVLIYGFFVLFLRGITEEELRAFPKGQVLVKALKKVKLM